MISHKDIENKVRKIIIAQLDISEEEVVPEASLANDLNVDSLDLVELLMKMEEDFEIQIPDEDAEQILTVQDAIKYIAKALDKQV